MDAENYLMKKPNNQGYRILDADFGRVCNDPEVSFEWALIDRGEGRTPVVGHWVKFNNKGWGQLDDIEWCHGHYFPTIEEAEVFYRKSVIDGLQEEIYELQEKLKYESARLAEAKKLLPEEED